jgi:hypothetical protein
VAARRHELLVRVLLAFATWAVCLADRLAGGGSPVDASPDASPDSAPGVASRADRLPRDRPSRMIGVPDAGAVRPDRGSVAAADPPRWAGLDRGWLAAVTAGAARGQRSAPVRDGRSYPALLQPDAPPAWPARAVSPPVSSLSAPTRSVSAPADPVLPLVRPAVPPTRMVLPPVRPPVLSPARLASPRVWLDARRTSADRNAPHHKAAPGVVARATPAPDDPPLWTTTGRRTDRPAAPDARRPEQQSPAPRPPAPPDADRWPSLPVEAPSWTVEKAGAPDPYAMRLRAEHEGTPWNG